MKYKLNKTTIIVGLIILFIVLMLPLSVVTIDAGFAGVRLRNGSVVGRLGDGLHFKIPFFEEVVKFEIRTIKKEVTADAASKDLQQIDATIALNYKVDPQNVDEIYKQLGINYEDRIVTPRLQESVKTVTARFTAEELITKRPQIREEILKEITEKLKSENIIVEDVSIVNFGFSKEFTAAIEEKQLAAQRVLKAQNDLERIKIESEQKITQAKADAEAQKLQQQTLNELLLQKQFIEKWDGKLPIVMGNDQQILDINSLLYSSNNR